MKHKMNFHGVDFFLQLSDDTMLLRYRALILLYSTEKIHKDAWKKQTGGTFRVEFFLAIKLNKKAYAV